MKKKTTEIAPPIKLPSNLILFDKKVNITLLVLFLLYFVLSFSKIQTSSVAIWDQVFGIKKSKSVIAGTPKGIRQDEWMVSTPAIISQYNNGFPISNPSFGDGNVPLMNGMPVKDITMILRPSLWAFFILDVERAFAFFWNFNIFIFLISMFLFLLLLTGNNYFLSLAGAIFIFSSAVMQWWSYWLGSPILFLNGIAISATYLLLGRKLKHIIIAGLVLVLSCYNYLIILYPPWQIPLTYLYLFAFAGIIVKNFDLQILKEKILFKAGSFAMAIGMLTLFGLHYLNLVKDTMDILFTTVYPGRRSTNGGDLIDGKLFSGFFDVFMNDTHVPQTWLNICEASGIVMFFPIVFYSIGYRYLKYKKIDLTSLLLAVCVLFLLVWILVGFPELLSKLTLMSMSPVYRTLPVLGIANCFLLISFLANKSKEENKISRVEFGILTVAIFGFISMVSAHINSATSDFFKPGQVNFIIFLITITYLMIRYNQLKFVQAVLALILLGMNFPHLKVNPLTRGLAPLLENDLVKITHEISKSDPNARWVVFGRPILTNLLKVNGINVFNGVKSVPILKDMKVLDPTGKDNFVYNRYAHINIEPYIDFKDTLVFRLNENKVVNDNYTIFLDPCSPKLEQIGIRYFLFTYEPKPEETRCMTPVINTGPFIYKR